MGGYAAEISTVAPGDDSAHRVDPSGFVVSHHLADGAEICVERLSGGHLFHLAIAGCVFNTLFQLAAARNVKLRECRVVVDGEFDDVAPKSKGISYAIELAGDASPDELSAIAREADAKSDIPNLLRADTSVVLRGASVSGASRASAV
ncbi:MAG TPA: OsmC family protein [Gaiellaceae bacterium]|nr:OsmC family protein [Gaiellaceae bacterium]